MRVRIHILDTDGRAPIFDGVRNLVIVPSVGDRVPSATVDGYHAPIVAQRDIHAEHVEVRCWATRRAVTP